MSTNGQLLIGGTSGPAVATLTAGTGISISNSDGGITVTNSSPSAATALDDIGVGDSASTLATSAGDITIDAQGNDTDIIFKGTDGSADTTFLTLDGSDAGKALFNADVQVGDDLFLNTDSSVINMGAGNDVTFTHDGTTGLTIAANPITLDSGADITFDAAGNDFSFQSGGTEVLKITNSSSDVIIKPVVDEKDIIFQQRDGTEVARVEDNGTFNIVTDKLAINGTAVTSTAAELNILDGVTSTAAELNILDGVTATASELNLLDGGTSVGSSITVVDADGFVVNDGGTMKTIPASDVKTYAGISGDITLGTDEKLILDTTPSDDNGSGLIVKGTIASGVNAGETVYLNGSGEYARADKSDASTMPAVGVAMEATGSNKKILIFGVIRNAGFSLTQGEEVYQDDNGFMTTTPPGSTSGDLLQRLGVALDSTHVLFNPSLDTIEHA